jgi:tellurite resistance protein
VTGAREFVAVAGALTNAANGYEADERAAVHRLLGVW